MDELTHRCAITLTRTLSDLQDGPAIVKDAVDILTEMDGLDVDLNEVVRALPTVEYATLWDKETKGIYD